MQTHSKATILLVEDDPDVRDAVADILEEHGYRVVTANNGEEALKHLQQEKLRPSIVLLDLMMPVMDGWQFREIQKNDPAISDIPVIALTAHLELRSVDAVAHLRKPLALDLLLETVALVSSSSRLQRAAFNEPRK